MSLTQDFKDKPIEFLANYIVVVQDDSEGVPSTDPADFFLRKAAPSIETNNYVFLLKRSALRTSTEYIPAYWLPWKKGKANVLTLGDRAQFMFTSEMTNCRFSVLTGDMANPMVSHVEGTGSFSKRDAFEVTAGFPARDESEKRMRRLSVSGIKNPTRDASDIATPKHRYYGQDGAEKSSAFVFGYREDTTWKFYAQIVKGVIAGDGMNALKSATERVVPYDQAYEIA